MSLTIKKQTLLNKFNLTNQKEHGGWSGFLNWIQRGYKDPVVPSGASILLPSGTLKFIKIIVRAWLVNKGEKYPIIFTGSNGTILDFTEHGKKVCW